MPRVKRTEICARDEIQAFHLINRCVRRTYLCGKDRRSGKDYSHRKQWIRERLEELAGVYGIDVLGFAVMSNHLHVVVRTRPDVVKAWSDGEVALRWWRLFPQRRDEDYSPAEPTEFELNSIRNDTAGLKEKRSRLSDISWFMRCLAEPIARRGNKDDEVTGRFWEGRFKAQALLDETALAACMAYVDLNPIRAGLAATPETSDFTSVKERIADACGECSVGSFQCSENSAESDEAPSFPARRDHLSISPEPGAKGKNEEAPSSPGAPGSATFSPESGEKGLGTGPRAGWLAPIAEETHAQDSGSVSGPATTECSTPAATESAPEQKYSGHRKQNLRRASSRGCLPMSLDEYLRLLDWTGRQIRKDKAGKIPTECGPILERLKCSAETWLDLIQNFRKRFRAEAGLPKAVLSFREARQSRRASVVS